MAHGQKPHKSTVTWAQVPVEEPDLSAWVVSFGNSGAVSVHGPCPACAGDAWGPPLPEAGVAPGGAELVEMQPVDLDAPASVGAACHCGYEHGKTGASGCGRFWSVPAPAERDSD